MKVVVPRRKVNTTHEQLDVHMIQMGILEHSKHAMANISSTSLQVVDEYRLDAHLGGSPVSSSSPSLPPPVATYLPIPDLALPSFPVDIPSRVEDQTDQYWSLY